jgi:hypothetical protein
VAGANTTGRATARTRWIATIWLAGVFGLIVVPAICAFFGLLSWVGSDEIPEKLNYVWGWFIALAVIFVGSTVTIWYSTWKLRRSVTGPVWIILGLILVAPWAYLTLQVIQN